MKMCMHCYVTGKVQGVWYRAHTKEKADALGITGFARNLADGRVEVIACGEKEQLDELFAWLKQGPPLAEVSDLSYEAMEWKEYSGFRTM